MEVGRLDERDADGVNEADDEVLTDLVVANEEMVPDDEADLLEEADVDAETEMTRDVADEVMTADDDGEREDELDEV